MTFEAVYGLPLGPKFPTSLSDSDIDELIALALALDTGLGANGSAVSISSGA
jgi:hypothetical protein